ncbi:MAG: glycosyltransferase [Anaerobiospirillum succiniciproducens]|uniref:glycosyltransferase n=1 Tax=Anaerobiospirillum succiniciproducens TaxID=13335 RepID=UPI00048A439C|nr:glycosyltransferase [Anaerobiospirillum succiniciproducens]MCI6863497.1 glycosyltransferase [Anaerobiospirillum succiniciproducens]MDO4676769.1 glycosyltransferase [Anaerobiospirillum succiniciproducens]MDY2799223.1 glycosyltransferase [Anaerobiospirillum succiniciproducens]
MPKLLWVSPLSVHDSSNPSAAQMRNMLLSLKARGIEIIGLSALNFLNESGTSMFTDLDDKLKGNETSFNLEDNGIKFIYIRTKSRKLGDMISQEQRNFYAKFCAIINAFRPDVVMGSGTDMLSMVCFDEARRRGLPTTYTLLDGTPARFNFPNIDLVVTDSAATSNLYATKHRINSVVTGSFTEVTGPLAFGGKVEHDPSNKKFITMVEPTVDKGLGIFLRLSQNVPAQARNLKFAVRESYAGQFTEQVALLKDKANPNKAPFTKAALSKIFVLGPEVTDAELFESTKVLMVPSLSFESINNISREAITYGVPVLATNQTGLAESIGEAGVLVEIPEYCLNNHYMAPAAEDLANFYKGLQIILTEDFTNRTADVAKRYNINYSANRLAATLKPLFDKCAGNNPQLLRNGSLI